MPFDTRFPESHALSTEEIAGLVEAFVIAARRAVQAGFQLIELHGAHGYLFHQFLSSLSNAREDQYGGDWNNRTRFMLETVDAVREAIPAEMPLAVRLSCTDWVENGWNEDDSVLLSIMLREHGVDLIDCSSGGNVSRAPIPVGPGYQVPFAKRIHREAKIPTAAVGLITEPAQADALIREESADIVALARAELRDPNWTLHAAQALGHAVEWPVQYDRAKPTPD